jgi:hypothetical protein
LRPLFLFATLCFPTRMGTKANQNGNVSPFCEAVT